MPLVGTRLGATIRDVNRSPWLPLSLILVAGVAGVAAAPSSGPTSTLAPDPARRLVTAVIADLEAGNRPDLARELRSLVGGPGAPAARSWLDEPPAPSATPEVPRRAVAEMLQDLGRVEDLRRLLGTLPTPPPVWAHRLRTWLARVRGLRPLGPPEAGLPFAWRLWLGDELRALEPGPGEDGLAWIQALATRAWVAAPTTQPQVFRHFLRRVMAEGQRHAGFFTSARAGPEEAEVLLLMARNLSRSPSQRWAALEAYQVLVSRTRGAHGPEAPRRIRQAGDLGRRELATLWEQGGHRVRAIRIRRDQLHRTRAGSDVGREAARDREALAALIPGSVEAAFLHAEAARLRAD